MRARVRRRPALILPLAVGALRLAACGGGPAASLSGPAPLPTPSSGPMAMNMALLGHVDLAAMAAAAHADHDEPGFLPGALSGAGNWGYTSPDGRRFALTGTSAGLSVVEVSDPARPRAVALVPGAASEWREVKTFRDYAYVTTEARTGLDIVSLRDPDHPRKVQTWNRTFMSAHTLWIDAARGLLFANGADGRTGGMHVLDVGTNPEDPEEVGAFHGFYVHDSYARGTVLFASAIYDGFEALLDVADPAHIAEITRFTTDGHTTHNSWPTRDGRYLFTTDERTGMPIEGWDLGDPRAPRKVSQFIANPLAIPHNVVIDGDRLLLAHYTEGVYLLDVKDPEHPRVTGWYDTYPGPSGGFNGVWGAYVFPGTNLVLASDMTGGLFVLGYTGP